MARNPSLPSGTTGLDIHVNYDAFYDAFALVTYQDSSNVTQPVNFTGYQAIDLQVRANEGDILPLVKFNDTIGNLKFATDRTLGKFQFAITPQQMDMLVPGVYVYDLFVIDSLGHPKKWTAGNFYVASRGAVK